MPVEKEFAAAVGIHKGRRFGRHDEKGRSRRPAHFFARQIIVPVGGSLACKVVPQASIKPITASDRFIIARFEWAGTSEAGPWRKILAFIGGTTERFKTGDVAIKKTIGRFGHTPEVWDIKASRRVLSA